MDFPEDNTQETTNSASPVEENGSSVAPDDKQESVKPDLSKAVAEKNKIIKGLKQEVGEYRNEIETLKQELSKIKKQEEEDPFLSEDEKKSSEFEKKIIELEQKKNEIESKLKEQEIAAQVHAIDNKLAELKKLDPNLTESDLLDILVEVKRKTGGRVNDLSLFDDIYWAKKARRDKKIQNRETIATETPTQLAAPIAEKPRNVHEAFELLRRRRKK